LSEEIHGQSTAANEPFAPRECARPGHSNVRSPIACFFTSDLLRLEKKAPRTNIQAPENLQTSSAQKGLGSSVDRRFRNREGWKSVLHWSAWSLDFGAFPKELGCWRLVLSTLRANRSPPECARPGHSNVRSSVV